MTITAVVFGTATVGMPEAASDGLCATDAIGSIAVRRESMSFIPCPFHLVSVAGFGIEYARTLYRQKNLLFSEALYKKVPRLHQYLLTPLRGGSNPGHHQHPRHTGEQHAELRHFLFSCLTGDEGK